MFIRFDVIHERDGWTLHNNKDRAYAYASRGKNHLTFWRYNSFFIHFSAERLYVTFGLWHESSVCL